MKIRECPMCGQTVRVRNHNKTIIKGELAYNCYVYCERCDVRGPRVLYDDYETASEAHQEAVRRWNVRCYEKTDRIL